MEASLWYQSLVRPSWAPPAWVFGPVWTVLYIIIIFSFGTVFVLALLKKIPVATALPFALNLLLNIAFSPIQFGLRNLLFASMDILLVLATLIWAILAIYPVRRWIAYAQIPYVLWVGFATVLQLTITILNW